MRISCCDLLAALVVCVEHALRHELVDGEAATYWVNSTDVASALSEIGRRFDGADLSTSRSSSIGRTGLSLQVVTPKVVRIKIGAKDLRRKKVAALTVADVLRLGLARALEFATLAMGALVAAAAAPTASERNQRSLVCAPK